MHFARRLTSLLLPLAALPAFGQGIERVKLTDGELACSQVHAEITNMEAVAKAMPNAAAQAGARKDFLTGLFVARGCKLSDLSFAGNPVPPDTFRRLMAAAPSAPATAPMAAAPGAPAGPASIADVQAALQAPATPLDTSSLMKGNATLKGKRFYISEYRVMFEAGGSVTASTRAAYFGGTDHGATRMTVRYEVPQLDIGVLQAITDRAYMDFLQRMEAAGARPEAADAFVRENGAIYEATLEGSKPGAPVIEEADLGYGKRRYIVMAPTGTRLNSRGFAGLGAGNIGNRINWSKANLEGVSVALAVNLAAQESSGSGSSLFRRGSSANASAAMEVTAVHRAQLMQTHAMTNVVNLGGPVAVPGQFGTLRESGGYDTRQDAAVAGIQALGRMMGQAANNSKRVDMTLDVDHTAMSRLALQGLASVNQGIASAVR